jgi:cytochrome c-type biogenesis protein CcmH
MLSVEMFIIYCLMLALALYFIVPSLLMPQDEKLAEVKASLEHRLDQLKQEFQLQNKELARRLKNGDLAEQEWQQLNDELQLETTTAIDATINSTQTSKQHRSTIVAMICAALLAVISYVLYWQGESKAQAENQMQIQSLIAEDPNAIKNLIDKARHAAESSELSESARAANNLDNWQQLYLALRTKLEVQPSNIELWREFASFNAKVGRTNEAYASLKQAIKISPDNFELQLELAQLYATAKTEAEQSQANRMLRRLVNRQPEHQGARIILAFNAYNLADYATAISQWQYLLSQREAGSSSAQMLQNSIEAARAKLKNTDPTAASIINNDISAESASANADAESDYSAASSAEASASINVQISFSADVFKQLKQQFSGNESLFVFAKAVDGPRFPVAVVKLSLASVLSQTDQQNKPFKLSLSDANAMQAAFSLSKFEKVVVSARLSKTGNAIAQAGDLDSNQIQLSAPFKQQAASLRFE